jgi:hypothetical protein
MLQTFINGITLKSVAESLKARVVEENEKEQLRIANLNQRIKNFSGSREDITEGLIEVNAELAGLQNAVGSLVEGSDTRVKLENRINRLVYQKGVFESRDKSKGADVLVEIAQDILVSEATVALNNTLIGLLDTKIASMA